MKVAFLGRTLDMASTRYRVVLPAMALNNLGVEITPDCETLIFGKDKIDPQVLAKYPKRIYDVCDDNFDCALRGEEYRKHVAESQAVTCNSDAMRFVIHKKCNRIATVIPDPFEHEEWEPGWGEGLLWFGHSVNVKDLLRVLPGLPPVKAITSNTSRLDSYIEWSPQAVDEGLKSCAVVIIPTGRAVTKSANRLIESVRAGRFVVAEPLPAYEEFGEWMWVGDLREGVRWALANKDECLKRVKACQAYIREKYSPDRIGEMWLKVLKSV